MFDFSHSTMIQNVCPTYSLVETKQFNQATAWVPPLLNARSLAALAKAESQIEELARMQPDWDGYGALPISGATKYNSLESLRSVLVYAPTPEITPNSNGTLSFEWETKQGTAHLEIGQTRLSFYIKPRRGQPVFVEANSDDLLLKSIKVGILISATLFPLQHGTTSLTTVSLAADVSATY